MDKIENILFDFFSKYLKFMEIAYIWLWKGNVVVHLGLAIVAIEKAIAAIGIALIWCLQRCIFFAIKEDKI